MTRCFTRTKPTEATVCRRGLGARFRLRRHNNERLTSARRIGAIGEEITIFECAARINLHAHTGIGQKSRRGPRQVKGGGPPRRHSTDSRHNGLALANHLRRNLVAAAADRWTNQSVNRPIGELADRLDGAGKDTAKEAATTRMDRRNDATGVGRQDDGQAVGRLDGEARRPDPPTRIDDDAVGPNRTPLPRRTDFKARRGAHQPRRPLDARQGLDTRRMRLVHPDDVAADQARQGLAVPANERRIVTHMQAHIARKRAGGPVHPRPGDPGPRPQRGGQQRRKGGVSRPSGSGAAG